LNWSLNPLLNQALKSGRILPLSFRALFSRKTMGLISSHPEDKGFWLLVKLQLILHLKKPMVIS
jgi:hypothetical protein